MASSTRLERATDFLLSLVAPNKAAIRRHWRRVEREDDYRAAYEIALRARGYKSAKHDKNATPFLNASDRSADGELSPDLRTLRNRSRALDRDDPIASGIQKGFVRGVIGRGLRPQGTLEDKAKNDALESVWWSRADRLALGDGGLTSAEHQQLLYGKRIEDGDVLVRPAVDLETMTLWFETVEADRICTPIDAKPADPSGRIVDGVEKDASGRVVAYWVLKRHPGDAFYGSQAVPGSKVAGVVSIGSSKTDFDRVPASGACLERGRVTRPGQTRGAPLCHAILQDLHDLDLLMWSSLKRLQVAACLAVFLTSDGASTDILQLTAEDYGYQLDQKIEPGMVFRLFPGEKAEFLSPSGDGQAAVDAMAFLLARRIAAALGVSPQFVLRAWEGVSYSGARTIKIDDWSTFRLERDSFDGTLSWMWRIVHEHELLLGNETLLRAGVTALDLDSVEWIGDQEPYVDPEAEVAAIEVMLRLGLTTLQIEAARLGRDWEAMLAQQAKERELRKALGLPEQVAPGSPPPIKVQPARAEGEAPAPIRLLGR